MGCCLLVVRFGISDVSWLVEDGLPLADVEFLGEKDIGGVRDTRYFGGNFGIGVLHVGHCS